MKDNVNTSPLDIRDQIAAMQELPITGRPWLNNDIVIASTNRLRGQYAGQIAQALIASGCSAQSVATDDSMDAIMKLAGRLAGRVSLANETFAMEMYESASSYGPLTAIRASAHSADATSSGLASGSELIR